MHFFSVTKFDKSQFIPRNIKKMRKYYPNFQYSVIVPQNELNLFKKYFQDLSLHEIEILTRTYLPTQTRVSSYTDNNSKTRQNFIPQTFTSTHTQLFLSLISLNRLFA